MLLRKVKTRLQFLGMSCSMHVGSSVPHTLPSILEHVYCSAACCPLPRRSRASQR